MSNQLSRIATWAFVVREELKGAGAKDAGVLDPTLKELSDIGGGFAGVCVCRKFCKIQFNKISENLNLGGSARLCGVVWEDLEAFAG